MDFSLPGNFNSSIKPPTDMDLLYRKSSYDLKVSYRNGPICQPHNKPNSQPRGLHGYPVNPKNFTLSKRLLAAVAVLILIKTA